VVDDGASFADIFRRWGKEFSKVLISNTKILICFTEFLKLLEIPSDEDSFLKR
jgi:hypothetical protein